jgi:tripeptide aminopeptidase
MITNQNLIDRLFRYAAIDTQSDEESVTQPSTDKQHDLARLLYRELCDMGIEAYYDTEHCYVYATLPGEEPAIGFVAHMDTSPAASGCGVKPRIVDNYQGGNIVLREADSETDAIVLRPADFPNLHKHVGGDLIVTDGTTLLGSDDKSGVAEIMNLFEYYIAHPEALPEDFHPQMSFDGMERTVCDYIAGMTDNYAVDKYTEIFIPAGWHVRG